MASHVVVIDSSFRRTVVKVTAGTFMTDVLEEACAKFKLNASNYGLKNNNKPVDLSRPFRQTGLTSGAKLELVAASRTPTAITVALQVPDSLASGIPGGRLIDKFATNTTVWKILRHFESKPGSNLNFTARGVAEVENGGSAGAGRVYYEMPSINVMNRELSTFVELQKSLTQLGLTGGNCLLRLSFKKTTQPLEDAMQDIATYFKEEEATPAKEPPPAEARKQEPESVTAGLSSPPSEDTAMASAPEPEQAEPSPTVVVGANQRPVSVFSPPSSEVPQAALRPHDEDDYEPTIVHAKLHQARLQNNSQNKRLLSDAETEQLEKDKAAKLAATTEVFIKVRLPDQSSIVSTFKANETGLDLYQFVTEAIVADDQPFRLVYTNKGPQTVPRDTNKLLIKHLGLQGRVLVNFLWEDGATVDRKQQVLKPHLRQSAQDVKVPEIAPVELKEETKPSTVDKGKGKENSGDGRLKTPKWLRLPGKK